MCMVSQMGYAVSSRQCKQVPEVRNFMDSFRELSYFVNNSHKRKNILKSKISCKESDELYSDLKEHGNELLRYANRRQSLSTLCETRRLSRVDSLSTLLVKYDQVKNALDDIATESTGPARQNACAHVKKMGFLLASLWSQ